MSSIIPGAYARAAGVQSEISKVTVTRVAGSEVEFRRTIDTYQKDLRYNVNQIGREQRLLRRSLKRYSKKLLDSKKLRQQRQAKAKEQADRQKQHTKQFREAQQSLENAVPFVPPEESFSRQLDATQVYDSENDFIAEQQPNITPTLPDSPDSGVGSETEETVPPGSTHTAQSHDPVDNSQICGLQKAFLTSSKGKPPYLKAKRGGRSNKQEPRGDHQFRMSSAQDCAIVSTRLSDSDELLPSITEENEDGVDQFKFSISAPDEVVDEQQKPANEHQADSQTSSSVGTQLPVITSLDTKSVSQAGKTCMEPSTPAHSTKVTKPDEEDNRVNAEGTGVQVTRKKPRRKTGVSYGDLIKLQHTHTSSTKQLFELVDRLASVHGIADPPPQPPSTPSSLDPRNNVKIKQKLNATRTSDGIVKQAAVLYPMKYGYNIPDNQSDVARSPVPEALETSNHSMGENGGEVTVRCRHARRSVPRIPDIVLDPTRHSRHRVRHDSTDVTSPFYEFTEAASSIFDDFIFEGRSPPPRRNKGKPLTLTELSVQATKIRERTLHGSQISQDRPEPIHNNTAQPSNNRRLKSDRDEETSSTTQVHRPRRKSRVVSPGTRRSRRRDSVHEQLQRRLNDGEEVEKMAWQSAFGRLKMIHTLYDLSQHFQ